MDILAVATGVGPQVVRLTAEGGGAVPDQPVLGDRQRGQLHPVLRDHLVRSRSSPSSEMLADRKQRIEQGLKDAEQARRDRENAETERVAALTEARREANDDPDPRPEGRPGDARRGHRRDPRGARAAARPGGRARSRPRRPRAIAERPRRGRRPGAPAPPARVVGEIDDRRRASGGSSRSSCAPPARRTRRTDGAR